MMCALLSSYHSNKFGLGSGIEKSQGHLNHAVGIVIESSLLEILSAGFRIGTSHENYDVSVQIQLEVSTTGYNTFMFMWNAVCLLYSTK